MESKPKIIYAYNHLGLIYFTVDENFKTVYTYTIKDFFNKVNKRNSIKGEKKRYHTDSKLDIFEIGGVFRVTLDEGIEIVKKSLNLFGYGK